MSQTFHFKGVYTPKGWLENVLIETDDSGLISRIAPNTLTCPSHVEKVEGFALPGLINAHSHAFQYAMAGLTEQGSSAHPADDFWSWRTHMYSLALTIGPEELLDIATMLYSEMLRHGYTHVVEFHYLHHNLEGQPYENIGLMGEQLLIAADRVGIQITLIPIFYQMGHFKQIPSTHQRRFISQSPEAYFKLLEKSQELSRSFPRAHIGQGVHSIRAVNVDALKAIYNAKPDHMPFHLHIAEQTKEVEQAIETLGQRPIEWLIDQIDLNAQCHLVHATHIQSHELKALAHQNVNVVLCPSTEGNLGDGIFPLTQYLQLSGRFSIGTDSHIGLNPFEELRWLDYTQRLTLNVRNPLASSSQRSSGDVLFWNSYYSGLSAMGLPKQEPFTEHSPLDALVVKSDIPLMHNSSAKYRLATLLYTQEGFPLLGTIVSGQWKVKHNEHVDHKSIHRAFTQTLHTLKARQ